MAQENCPFAYRKRMDVSVHCTKQQPPYDYCIDTYYCNSTKRYEAMKGSSKNCRFRQENYNNSVQVEQPRGK